MNDSIMVSCVSDVMGRSDLKNIMDNESRPPVKDLIFNVDCKNAEKNEKDRKFDCMVGFDVYDTYASD